MENPYYEIVALMRALGGRGGDGLFSATVRTTAAGIVSAQVDGQALEADLWLAGGLTFTQEDDGCAVLCIPFDRGFLVLSKLKAA